MGKDSHLLTRDVRHIFAMLCGSVVRSMFASRWPPSCLSTSAPCTPASLSRFLLFYALLLFPYRQYLDSVNLTMTALPLCRRRGARQRPQITGSVSSLCVYNKLSCCIWAERTSLVTPAAVKREPKQYCFHCYCSPLRTMRLQSLSNLERLSYILTSRAIESYLLLL